MSHLIVKRSPLPAKRQQGVVLFVALIVLVLMTLAGLGMMRQVGSGLSVAGNLAFKQNATSGAELGTSAAIVVLQPLINTASAVLDSDDATNGYFSTWAVGFDPATHDWANKSKLASANDGTGNEVRYVIHRLCKTANLTPTDAAQQCSLRPSPEGNPNEGLTNSKPPDPVYSAYFRITNRVVGVRNTVSYTQVITY